MFSQLARLLIAMVATWLVLVGPAYLVGGALAVVGMTAAVLVCLVPGVVVLLLQAKLLANQPPLSNLMVSMGLRMAVVLASVLVVRQAWPQLSAAFYAAWLVPAYLVALTVETRVALTQSVAFSDTSQVRAVPPLN